MGASLIPLFLQLLSNPLVALNMAPEDYAITGYYSSFSSLISPLVVFYMLHYFAKRYFEVSENDRKELISLLVKSLIFFSFAMTILGLLGLYLYIYVFNSQSTIPFFPYAFLSVFAIPLSGIYQLMLLDYKMMRQSRIYFRVSIFLSLLSISLVITFVVIFKLGAFGKLFATFLTNLILFCYSLHHYRLLFYKSFDFYHFREMIKFCFPLTIAAILGFFSDGFDKVFLERLGNEKELGYYVVGCQMASYVGIFQSAIRNTFQPDIYESIVNRQKKRLLYVTSGIIISTTIIICIYIFAAPIIVMLLTAGKYMMSVKYTQIICLSVLTSTLYYTVSEVTIASGRSHLTLINKIITAICSVILFSWLIDRYQFEGAAWGLVLSFAISFVGNLFLLYIDIRYPLRLKNYVAKNSRTQ